MAVLIELVQQIKVESVFQIFNIDGWIRCPRSIL